MRIFQSVSEIEFMKKWNGVINYDESNLMFRSDASVVIYEKRKQYGMFYLPRDYVYMRHVFKKEGDLFVIDKSVDHDETP